MHDTYLLTYMQECVGSETAIIYSLFTEFFTV